jgi:hypothetical protein
MAKKSPPAILNRVDEDMVLLWLAILVLLT